MIKKPEKIKLQASQINRIWNCPGSLYLDQELDSVYKFNPWKGKANFGSLLHSIAEMKLSNAELKVPELLKDAGLVRGTSQYSTALHTIKYYEKSILKIIKQLRKKTSIEPEIYVEEKFRVTVAGVECVAKMDGMFITKTPDVIHIDIFDLKTGNFDYSESGKDQLFFSVLVVIAKLFKKEKRQIIYNGHIVQPNYWNEDRRHITPINGEADVNTLLFVLHSQNKSILLSTKEDIENGSWCKFCPAMLVCSKSQ
jgi:hypothetical protein